MIRKLGMLLNCLDSSVQTGRDFRHWCRSLDKRLHFALACSFEQHNLLVADAGHLCDISVADANDLSDMLLAGAKGLCNSVVAAAGCGNLAAVHWGHCAVSSLHFHAVGHLQCHPSLPHPALCHLWTGTQHHTMSVFCLYGAAAALQQGS